MIKTVLSPISAHILSPGLPSIAIDSPDLVQMGGPKMEGETDFGAATMSKVRPKQTWSERKFSNTQDVGGGKREV